MQDLESKALIRRVAEAPLTLEQEARALDLALDQDPWDHHLVLARAQVARRAGDKETTNRLLTRYATCAPADPRRYFRLAEAQTQPGFNARHQQEMAKRFSLAQAPSTP